MLYGHSREVFMLPQRSQRSNVNFDDEPPEAISYDIPTPDVDSEAKKPM
jgi:hypothetical protein